MCRRALKKLRAGQVDATFLAMAGLKRLGLEHEVSSIIGVDDMLPAVGQGAVGIEVRQSDLKNLSFISQFSCNKTYVCVSCERGVLRALGGSCHTPVGVYAMYENGEVHLRVQVAALDGSKIWGDEVKKQISSVEEAIALGEAVGEKLRVEVPPEVLVA